MFGLKRKMERMFGPEWRGIERIVNDMVGHQMETLSRLYYIEPIIWRDPFFLGYIMGAILWVEDDIRVPLTNEDRKKILESLISERWGRGEAVARQAVFDCQQFNATHDREFDNGKRAGKELTAEMLKLVRNGNHLPQGKTIGEFVYELQDRLLVAPLKQRGLLEFVLPGA